MVHCAQIIDASLQTWGWIGIQFHLNEMLWSFPITYMLFSKNLISSELRSALSSTINSASLLPGNTVSGTHVLRTVGNKILLAWRCIHRYSDGVVYYNGVKSHIPMVSTSTDEIPSFPVTLLWASALNCPWRRVWRQTASDGIATGISSHSTDRWSYLMKGKWWPT